MPSNSLLHFITKVINFEGVKVTNYEFIAEEIIVIELQNIEKKALCPPWGKSTDKIHQNHQYRVRDISLSDYQVFLPVNRRQFRCLKGNKVSSEELSFVGVSH